MTRDVLKILDTVSENLNTQHIRELEKRYVDTLKYNQVDRLPIIMSYPLDGDELFSQLECIDNPNCMLFNQLVSAFDTSILHTHEVGDDLPITVRANFGTVLIASLLGGQVEYRANNPGWVKPFESIDICKKMIEVDPVQRLTMGLGKNVLETYERYHELISQFENLYEMTNIVFPDTQGPFDTAEQLIGSEIYIQLYDDPEFITKILAYIAQIQSLFLDTLKPFVKERVKGYSHQHAVMMKGTVLIRNDSTTLISPDMYSEHVSSHDQYLLESQNGGGIHSCGKIEQLIPMYLKIPNLECIDIGQSELNDVDWIYAQASQRKIPILRITASREELADGSILKRFPSGVVLKYHASSRKEAQDVMDGYRLASRSQ